MRVCVVYTHMWCMCVYMYVHVCVHVYMSVFFLGGVL